MLTASALLLPLALAFAAVGATRLACSALRGDERDYPLSARVILGITLITAVAGWFVAARVYSRGVAVALLAVGCLGLLLPRSPRSDAKPATNWLSLKWGGAAALVVAAFVIVRGLAALRHPRYNPCDDWVVYLHFPRLLLESGGFDEPFGMRRLGVLGAGPFLQGFFWPGFGISANPVADAVFGQIGVIAGVLVARRVVAPEARSKAAELAFVGIALLASLTIPHLNTLPVLLPYGATLLLLALHVRIYTQQPDARGTRDALLWGVFAAWLIGLRVSNAIVPAALWACALAHALWQRDRARLRQSAIAALATGVALLPWCISLWRSSETPLFPLIAGNHRFPSLFTEPLTTRQLTQYVLECLAVNRVPLLIALAGVVWFARVRARHALVQVAVVSALLVASTAFAMSAFDSYTVLRYSAPLVLPAFLLLGGALAFQAPARRWPPLALGVLAAAWLFTPVTAHLVFDPERFSHAWTAKRQVREWAKGLRRLTENPLELEDFGGRPPYEDAQSLLPPSARVVSTAEQAYLWRHDLHTIHGLDCLGQASPDPGMPFFQGAEAMASYFTALGYTHLAFTPPARSYCLYSNTHWLSHRTKGQWMWRQWAPYFLDFMSTQRELARTRKLVYRGSTLVVLDLRERVAEP